LHRSRLAGEYEESVELGVPAQVHQDIDLVGPHPVRDLVVAKGAISRQWSALRRSRLRGLVGARLVV